MDTQDPRYSAYKLFIDGEYDQLLDIIDPYLKKKESWAQAIMGKCYRGGHGVDLDLSIARHYFELAANQNDPQGQLLFGHHLLFEGNVELGRSYLNDAFDAGLPSAAGYIAQSFFNESDDPDSSSYQSGVDWLVKAAEAGDAAAMHQLGWIIAEKGDAESLTEALSWYEKASDLGYENSALNAGLAYANGRGTDIDYEKARHYYAIAADAGLTNALHNLGVLYCDGKGGDVDKDSAFNCFNAAAAQGSFLSSQSLSKMFAAGEVKNIAPNRSLELAWLMIAEQQAKDLGHIEPSILASRKQLLQELSDDEKYGAISILGVIGETNPRWVSTILADQYESGDIVEPDPEKSDFWREQVEANSADSNGQEDSLTTDTDLASLPKQTQAFVDWLPQLGFSEQQIHGLFVLVGLYAGSPISQEEMDQLMEALDVVIPNDRNAIINHLVSDYFEEYQLPIEEFCYRSGFEFSFRPIKVFEDMEPVHLLNLRDHGLLENSVTGIDKLLDASRLFSSFLTALGESTYRQERSLKEAYLAGIYQMQHMAQIDHSAVQQLRHIIRTTRPLVIGQVFSAFTQNSLDYTMNCERVQVALLSLMAGMNEEYARHLWAFQSALFFHEQQRITGVDELDPEGWHRWVVDRARAFGDAYPTQLAPFSRSGVTLNRTPEWRNSIGIFEMCDQFISEGWAYSFTDIRSDLELLEYKALVVHAVYASLTISRESVH